MRFGEGFVRPRTVLGAVGVVLDAVLAKIRGGSWGGVLSGGPGKAVRFFRIPFKICFRISETKTSIQATEGRTRVIVIAHGLRKYPSTPRPTKIQSIGVTKCAHHPCAPAPTTNRHKQPNTNQPNRLHAIFFQATTQKTHIKPDISRAFGSNQICPFPQQMW